MPTKQEVADAVKVIIGEKANLNPALIIDTGKLTEAPLYMDNVKLGSLALSLRAYLQSINPALGLDVQAVRASGLTAAGLITLICTIIPAT
jgi:hypothetical protein